MVCADIGNYTLKIPKIIVHISKAECYLSCTHERGTKRYQLDNVVDA